MTEITKHFAYTNGVRIHYLLAGAGDPVLLIHGFPQTSHEWRSIMPALADKYTVIAPDYRGAGESEKTHGGYDKRNVMEDLRGVVHQLGFKNTPVRVVGHDMGVMVAYPYAAVYPDEVAQLVLMDAPVPGTQAIKDVRANPRAWHTNFHNARDLPEFLVQGREREYLEYFFKTRFTRPEAISQKDMDVYVRAYSQPGAMRAGFEMYRAWDEDEEHNKPYLESKLSMPLMVLGGKMSVSGPTLKKMSQDIAGDKAQFYEIPDAGHWLCEQNPDEVTERLRAFFAEA